MDMVDNHTVTGFLSQQTSVGQATQVGQDSATGNGHCEMTDGKAWRLVDERYIFWTFEAIPVTVLSFDC